MSLNRIPLAGVIGSPIAHSKSPALHTHWLKTLGIAGHYIPIDVAQEDLEHIVKTLEATQWRISGANGAAAVLDMPPSTLRSRMKKLSIRR